MTMPRIFPIFTPILAAVALALFVAIVSAPRAFAAPPAPAPPAPAHEVVHNFSTPLPSGGGIRSAVDTADAKVGLASGKITYTLDPARRSASVNFPQQAFALSGPGKIMLWIKGDGSDNKLQITLRHAEVQVDVQQNRRVGNPSDFPLPPIALKETAWRQVTLDAAAIPPGRAVWWEAIAVTAPPAPPAPKPEPAPAGAPPAAPVPPAPDPALTGSFNLDDMILVPAERKPAYALSSGLVGPAVRDFSPDVALFLDARNFSAAKATFRARLTMTDRNQNTILDRDFPVELAPGESREARLDLKPENLQAYLPPFRVVGDILSPEFPQLAGRIDNTLVMGNAQILFADMGMLHSHWFTAGGFPRPGGRIQGEYNQWMPWLQGEGPRASALTQTSARVSRVEVPPDEARAAAATQPASMPPSRYAMKLDFAGDAVVYRGPDRYLPGNAFAAGVWVKGDGSKGELYAMFLDYTDGGDFWPGGWKRISNGERRICSLEFTDWRYFTVDLPGNGIGANTPRGSTDALDFPLELTCFRVVPTTGAPGSVLIGPVYTHTQLPAADSLAVQLAYDDADHQYAPARGAWAVVQNGSRAAARKINAAWDLLDRAGQPLASGTFAADLPAGQSAWQRIDLAPAAAAVQKAAGPFTLKVTATDAADASATTTRAIAIARPDSRVTLCDFESPRGYLGLKAEFINNAPPEGEPLSFTSADKAHVGQRSLALPWERDPEHEKGKERDKAKRSLTFTSIDPPLPGLPTEISLWLHGDGSGVMFHPVIGDRAAIPRGSVPRRYDLLLARTDGELVNAVRVDWTGWKQLRFKLPLIPPTWEQNVAAGYAPTYPLGLHLGLDADTADKTLEKGTIYVDDIEVVTHLPPDARVTATLRREGENNVIAPGAPIRVRVANADLAEAKKLTIAGGVFDWRGTRVAGAPSPDGKPPEITLAPGASADIAMEPALPPGAYACRVEVQLAAKAVASTDEDLVVGDLKPLLGPEASAALRDEWKLRKPVQDRYTPVDEDWDWVEFQPGNMQFDTMRGRAQRASSNGAEPWMLLGFSAYWASGMGFDKMMSGGFTRGPRHVGQGVDIFMIPKRDADWENYVEEAVRTVGKDVGGFIFWDNPDGASTLALPPDRCAKMLQLADKWRRAYCPDTPMVIGGMGRETALPYLAELAKRDVLPSIGGVNIRFDVGRLSPEDAQVSAFARELAQTIDPAANGDKRMVFTDLDWAVERAGQGLSVFDQAAYLARTDILLRAQSIRPMLAIRNADYERLGTGLVYRRVVASPPLQEKLTTYDIKPAWWALARVRPLLDSLKFVGAPVVADVVPGRTRATLWRRADGKPTLIVWRNNDAGWLSPAAAGIAVESAEDCLGSTVKPDKDGWYPLGPMPLILNVAPAADEAIEQSAERLRVRDG
ncbi:MAG: hypothetical protein NTW19_00015, partial [Planctomycetota bacterium]|nr:hypothetical protein [Planctomycetota bacterium]